MSAVAGQHPTPAPCPRCTGYGDAHYLTCPTLRLPSAQRCVYCGRWSYRRGWGCSNCGTCTVEDLAREVTA